MISPRIPARPISAYAVANALGTTTEAAVAGVFAGRSGLATSDAFEPTGAMLGELPAFASLPAELASWDTRQCRVAYSALRELRGDVRRAVLRWGPSRVAFLLGTSTGGMAATEAAYRHRARTGALPADFSLWRHHAFDAVPLAFRGLLGITGPWLVVSTACSSSGKALASALRWIEADIADAVVVGGVDSLCELAVRGFHSLNILSSSACRPFGAERKGINIGEGAAFALLERDVDPAATTRGWLLGVGESCDGHHMTAPRADGLGAAMAMRAALDQAGVSPSDVGYVNAHGTGTVLNDAAEALAIADVLGETPRVSSTKGAFGHLLGAAGAAEAIVCLAALERQALPPNLTGDRRDPTITLELVSGAASKLDERQAPLRFALSNSFAFGGNNVSVLLGSERPVPAPAPVHYEVDVVDVSLWAPGFPSLDAWRAGARDDALTVPECRVLPARSRGRASLCSRLLLEVVSALATEANAVVLATVPTLFASALGEMETTVDLLDMLNRDAGELSPARFQASVHNTASGLFSIALQNPAYSTSVAAGVDTPALGLLEAYAWVRLHGGQLLVGIGDEASPESLAPSDPYSAIGVGVLLEGRLPGQPRPERRLGTLDGLSPEPVAVPERASNRAGSWRGNPCAAAVHLAEQLALHVRGDLSLAHPSARTGWTVRVR